jgi:hypothetical protein
LRIALSAPELIEWASSVGPGSITALTPSRSSQDGSGRIWAASRWSRAPGSTPHRAWCATPGARGSMIGFSIGAVALKSGGGSAGCRLPRRLGASCVLCLLLWDTPSLPARFVCFGRQSPSRLPLLPWPRGSARPERSEAGKWTSPML